jgi:hypothetical protein
MTQTYDEPFTTGDLEYLLRLVRHDLAEQRRRYIKPNQIAKRANLTGRDAAIWKIDQCQRCADTLEDMLNAFNGNTDYSDDWLQNQYHDIG